MSEVEPDGSTPPVVSTPATPPASVTTPALPDVGGSTGAFGDETLEINDEDLSAAADAMDSHADILRGIAGESTAVADALLDQARAHVPSGDPAPILRDATEGVRAALGELAEKVAALATLLTSDAKAFRKILSANTDKESTGAAKTSSIDAGIS